MKEITHERYRMSAFHIVSCVTYACLCAQLKTGIFNCPLHTIIAFPFFETRITLTLLLNVYEHSLALQI